MSISLSLEAFFYAIKMKNCPNLFALSLMMLTKREILLHMAWSRGILEEIEGLLDAGADVNARGELDDTPLQDAALSGHLPVVKMLLQKGADPDLGNQNGGMVGTLL